VVQFINALVSSLMAREDEGQGLVEYGLIIALVAIACVGVLGLLGGGVAGTFTTITGSL
jgi:pilus assembly protein Flp/PilA